MRITERMGLVYTALFLTVSVAVITQNSEALMAAFRGEQHVVAVDDIFTVTPGRDQRLLVLANDVASSQVRNNNIHLKGQPFCGKVTKVGGSFVYSESASCSSNQTFTYCLDTGATCVTAKVILRIENSLPVIASIEAGPAIVDQNLATQADINSQDLEITNVRLGKSADEEIAHLTKPGTKLAKVALETPAEIKRPAPLTGAKDVAGTFSMSPTTAFGRDTALEPVVEVASTDDVPPNKAVAEIDRTLTLPRAPFELATLPGLTRVERTSLVQHLATIDLDTPAIGDRSAFDKSPFGTPCGTSLTSRVLPGAIVELSLDAPCHPNSRVEIRHGKLMFTARTGHTGMLVLTVPALERAAIFSAEFADGVRLRTAQSISELADFERVAIQWNGAVDLSLHAYEFGARTDAAASAAGNKAALRDTDARSFSVKLGDASVEDPILVQVYSLRLTGPLVDGIVQFVVDAAPSETLCDQSEVLRSHHSKRGRLVGSAGLVFKMPACGTATQSIVLNNALRDLIIAGN